MWGGRGRGRATYRAWGGSSPHGALTSTQTLYAGETLSRLAPTDVRSHHSRHSYWNATAQCVTPSRYLRRLAAFLATNHDRAFPRSQSQGCPVYPRGGSTREAVKSDGFCPPKFPEFAISRIEPAPSTFDPHRMRSLFFSRLALCVQ